jgi:hypothetical protein
MKTCPHTQCSHTIFRAVPGRFIPACRRALRGHEVVRCVSRAKRTSRCCAPILRRHSDQEEYRKTLSTLRASPCRRRP